MSLNALNSNIIQGKLTFNGQNYQLLRWFDSTGYYSGNKYIYCDDANVGIGTNNPLGNNLFVNGLTVVNSNLTVGNTCMVNGSVGIGTTDVRGNRLYVNGKIFVNGVLTGTNDITAFQSISDDRLKTVIRYLTDSEAKLRTLSAFKYKTDNQLAKSYGFNENKVSIGLSAQQVQEVIPEVIDIAPFDASYENGEIKSKSGHNYLAIDYERMVPHLVQAIKELADKFDNIDNKLNNIKR